MQRKWYVWKIEEIGWLQQLCLWKKQLSLNDYLLLVSKWNYNWIFVETGVINRGDSFRRKRSRSNSLANSPMSPNQSPSVSNPSRAFGPVDSYRVHMLGGPGVGKTALISQFCTSECINAYEDTGECFFE